MESDIAQPRFWEPTDNGNSIFFLDTHMEETYRTVEFPLELSSKDHISQNNPNSLANKQHLKLLNIVSSLPTVKMDKSLGEISPAIINKLDKTQGASLLHYACMNGNLPMVNFLLENGADINLLDQNTRVTPIVCAAAHGHLDIVKTLLEHNSDASVGLNNCSELCSALIWAVRRNHPPVVRFLLEKKACQTSTIPFSETPVHVAVISGSPQILEMLMKTPGSKFRADLAMGLEKNTPLHLAASGDCPNSLELCKILLAQENVQVNTVNAKGETALHVAATWQDAEVVKLLLEHWANVNAADEKGRTSLFNAISDTDEALKCLGLLINRGKCDINHQDKVGNTGLHEAALQGVEGAAEILLVNGADFSIKNDAGITALSLLKRKIPEISVLLQKAFDQAVEMNNLQESSPEGRVDCGVNVNFDCVLPTLVSGIDHPSNIKKKKSRNQSIKSLRNETSKIKCLISENEEGLLSHPVIHSFLELKWQKARSVFLPALIFKVVLVILFSAYAQMPYVLNQRIVHSGTGFLPNSSAHMNDTHQSDIFVGPDATQERTPMWFKAFYAAIMSMAVLKGFMELIQILRAPKPQLRTLHPYISLTVLLIMIAYMRPGSWKRVQDPFHRSMAALGVLLSWIDIWIDMSRFPKVGLSIRVFIQVFKNFSLFVLPHTFLLAGFVLSFTLLFPQSGEFSSISMTMTKIIRVMAGDITLVPEGVKILSPHDSMQIKFSHLFLVYIYTAYVLIVAIVLMNLLIGLAVNDIQGIYADASVDKLVKQTILLNTLESSVNGKWTRSWVPIRAISKYINLFNPYAENICTFKPYDSRDSKLCYELKMALLDIGRTNHSRALANIEPEEINHSVNPSLKNLSHRWKKTVSKLKRNSVDEEGRVLMEKIGELVSSYVKSKEA